MSSAKFRLIGNIPAAAAILLSSEKAAAAFAALVAAATAAAAFILLLKREEVFARAGYTGLGVDFKDELPPPPPDTVRPVVTVDVVDGPAPPVSFLSTMGLRSC